MGVVEGVGVGKVHECMVGVVETGVALKNSGHETVDGAEEVI